MIYTLEHGVRKTWDEKIEQAVRYTAVALSSAALLLFIGNIWYAATYNPASSGSGTTAGARTSGTVRIVSSGASVSTGLPVGTGTAASNTSGAATQPASGSLLTTPARVNNQAADSTPIQTGGMGAGPVAAVPVPTADGGSSGGGTTGSTGTAAGTGGTPANDGGGTGGLGVGVEVPPLSADVPVVGAPVTTPGINLNL